MNTNNLNTSDFAKNKKTTLEITGMTCGHCATSIEKLFEGTKGIIDKNVSYKNGNGEFTHDANTISRNDIIKTINQTKNYRVKDGATDNGNSGNHFDLIIIGGGSAAFSAAITAGELGLSALMVNGGLPIGGTCVNVGCVPSKHLIRAAESIHKATHSPFNGIQPNKPDWDYKTIIRQKKELVAQMQKKKYKDIAGTLDNLKIIEGIAKFTDDKTISINENETYTGSKFLIATGATTNIPPFQGLSEIDYLTNVSIFDLEELPESLTVLGGGYIALEIAQAYHRFGSKVKIIQRSNHILSAQTPDISDELAKHLLNEGIEIHTGITIQSIKKAENNIIIKATKEGDPVQFIEPCKILVATGTKPNTQNLGLEKIGIELGKGGHIIVNEMQQTTLTHIFAAGDCTDTPAFVYTAANEAKIAIRNAFEGENNKVNYNGLPWVVFTDPQVSGAGIDEQEAEAKGIPYETSVIPLSEIPRAATALDTRGFIKLIRNPETDKLIGARIVAPEGGELAMQVSLAIKYGITVTELAESFHPYLTLSEGIKLAAITFRKDVAELSCCAS